MRVRDSHAGVLARRRQVAVRMKVIRAILRQVQLMLELCRQYKFRTLRMWALAAGAASMADC